MMRRNLSSFVLNSIRSWVEKLWVYERRKFLLSNRLTPSTSGRTSTRNLGFGYLLYRMEEWVEGKSNKTFLHFYQIFDIFDEFSKWSALKALPNYEKSSDMAKIWQQMKKSLLQLALTHFSMIVLQKPETRVSGTEYPIHC